MRGITITAVLIVSLSAINAFTITTVPLSNSVSVSSTTLYAYIPDGLTKQQWDNIKKKEAEKKANLGKVGVRGFKSRSFQSFQEALERGEASHMMPVFNAKEKLKKGEIKLEDIPYMQRGGSWVCNYILFFLYLYIIIMIFCVVYSIFNSDWFCCQL